MAIGQDLLNVPMGEMIRNMALAIADAQVALDGSSLNVAEMMSGHITSMDENGVPIVDETTGEVVTTDTRIYFGYDIDQNQDRQPVKVSMLELGFTPNFYQFVDTIIEVKIAIKMTFDSEYSSTTRTTTNSTSGSSRFGWLFKPSDKTVQTTQVDATYTAKYGYTAEGSSLLRTKLVPVPPPAILEERIRAIMEKERAASESA